MLFAESRRRAYVPLPAEREQVREHLEKRWQDATIAPLCLTGQSGLGKSALMADLARWLPQVFTGPEPWILEHYVGADGSRALETWRDRVLRHLQPYQPEQDGQRAEIPEEDKQRWDILPDWIAHARAQLERPMLFLIDALDQLDASRSATDRLGQLLWPAGTAVVATRIELPGGLWQCHALETPEPGLREEMIHALEAQYRKHLSEHQLARLLQAPQIAVPLYLRVLFEGLRLYARFEDLDDSIERMIAQPDAGALFGMLLDRMDEDHGDKRHQRIAHHTSALIAASRAGLSENELAGILAVEGDPIDISTQGTRLPGQIWSPLHARLSPYLLRDAGRLRLMHTILAGTVLGVDATTTRHELVAYFQGQEPRAVVERCFQYLELDDKDALCSELADINTLLCLHRGDASLLARALDRLGAGQAGQDNEAIALARQWQETLISLDTLPEGADVLSTWFTQFAYMGIGVLWAHALLDWRRGHLPAGHPDIARGLNNLASLYKHQDRLDAAEPLMEEALEVSRQALPAGHPAIAMCLNNLAQLYQAQGRLDEAEPLMEEALEIYRQVRPAVHPDVARGLNNLAGLYKEKDLLDKAKPLQEEALEIYRQALPAGDPAIAMCLNNLAALYQAQKRMDAAEPLYKEALEIFRHALPAGHPAIAMCLNNLAGLYQAQRRLDAAEPLMKEALEISRHALRPGHPDIAQSLNNLARLYQAQRRLDAAEPLYKEALEIYRQARPAVHPDIAKSLNNLAQLYRAQRQLDAAEPLMKESLEIYRQARPAGDPDIAIGLDNLACVYRDQRRLDAAEPLMKEALEIRRQALRPGDPDIAMSLNNLAHVYWDQDRLDAAEPLMKEALEIFRQALPAGDPYIATVLNNLARLYQAQGRDDEAKILLEGSLNS